jgi:hypothetical protein
MNKIGLSRCIIHEKQIVRELCSGDERCYVTYLRTDGELYPRIMVFQNLTTQKTVIARTMDRGWFKKLAVGKTRAEAITNWKARNDPLSLF